MLWAFFKKEYTKLKVYWLFLLALNLLVVGYVFLETRELFRLDHAEIVWYRAFELGRLHFEALIYLPLINGLFLGLAQFLPEMQQERLRLSLHLPISPHLMIISHLLAGLSMLVTALLIDSLGLIWSTGWFFPEEMIRMSLLTFAPWALAGCAIYLGSALVLLEPSAKHKICNAIAVFGLCGLLYETYVPQAYEHILLWLVSATCLLIPSACHAAYRYRYRSLD